MSDYYFDENHGVAYKVDPIVTSVVKERRSPSLEAIIVLTDVKVTNIKKEKIRRTLSEIYPSDKFDLESAKKAFSDKMLSPLVNGAKRISEQEYQMLKDRFEA